MHKGHESTEFPGRWCTSAKSSMRPQGDYAYGHGFQLGPGAFKHMGQHFNEAPARPPTGI